MDPLSSPGPATPRRRRGSRAPISVAALIVLMVAVSIVGSAAWRPARIERVTLELGGPTPVGLDARTPDETISRVLDLVRPTVAFLTIPETLRSGSGVVVHEAGFVVTNAHVVEGADELTVAFDDGAQYTGRVYGVDTSTDLAVVKLDTDEPIRPAALGDSDELQVGEFVLAVGAPFGLAASATSGIVSGLHRNGLGIARYEDFIVTDAPINRGNSGGPLVNLRGEVVGINTAIIAGEEEAHGMGGFAGVGFAIPVNVMRVVAQRLIGDGGLGPETSETTRGAEGEAGTVSGGPGAAGEANGALLSGGRVRRVGELATERQTGGPADSVAYIQSFNQRGRSVADGTGFVVDSELGNLLLTNAHVVSQAEVVAVFFPGERNAVQGRVLAADDGLDLALVSLPGEEGRPPLEVVGAEGVDVGQTVTARAGRVSGQSVTAVPNSGEVVARGVVLRRIATRATLFETNASIEPGDSGGPLLNVAGSVVGVTVARESRNGGQGPEQRSYAIELYLDDNFAWIMGIAANPGFDERFRPAFPGERPYVMVTTLEPESPLYEAGLRENDRIMSVNGAPFDTRDRGRREAFLAFKRLAPGTEVTIEVSRRAEGRGDERENVEILFVVPDW